MINNFRSFRNANRNNETISYLNIDMIDTALTMIEKFNKKPFNLESLNAKINSIKLITNENNLDLYIYSMK